MSTIQVTMDIVIGEEITADYALWVTSHYVFTTTVRNFAEDTSQVPTGKTRG